MPVKLSIPSVTAISDDNMTFGTRVFLQSVEDALKTVDNNVLYRDAVTAPATAIAPRAIAAQGQSFSISSVNVASGDDFATAVNDLRALLQSHIQLQQTVDTLIKQIRGK